MSQPTASQLLSSDRYTSINYERWFDQSLFPTMKFRVLRDPLSDEFRRHLVYLVMTTRADRAADRRRATAVKRSLRRLARHGAGPAVVAKPVRSRRGLWRFYPMVTAPPPSLAEAVALERER